jgi:hypothetical protein
MDNSEGLTKRTSLHFLYLTFPNIYNSVHYLPDVHMHQLSLYLPLKSPPILPFSLINTWNSDSVNYTHKTNQSWIQSRDNPTDPPNKPTYNLTSTDINTANYLSLSSQRPQQAQQHELPTCQSIPFCDGTGKDEHKMVLGYVWSQAQIMWGICF